MKLREEILAELDALIAEAERLDSSFHLANMGTYQSTAPEYEHRTFVTAALAAVGRIAGPSSEFYQGIQMPKDGTRISVPGYSPTVIPSTRGSLVALRSAVAAGLLQSLESRLRASIHDDFLEQASELRAAEYHVAAMVLIGGVLEDHLRRLCEARALAWKGAGGLSKYNDLLRDQVYPQSTWRRIQAIADVRNEAAHGNGGRVKPDDVEDAIPFVRRVIDDYST